jgi:serine/threonine protein kinase
MGNCNFRVDSSDPTIGKFYTDLNRNHFSLHYVIGKGGFGKVFKVLHKRSKVLYAMKEMQKGRVIAKKSVNSVLNERKLLA